MGYLLADAACLQHLCRDAAFRQCLYDGTRTAFGQGGVVGQRAAGVGAPRDEVVARSVGTQDVCDAVDITHLRRRTLPFAADAPQQAHVALPGIGDAAVGHDEVVSLQPESQPVVEPEVHACSHREGQEVTAVAALLVEVVGEVPLHLFGVEAFQPVVADGEVLVQVVRPGTQEGVDVGRAEVFAQPPLQAHPCHGGPAFLLAAADGVCGEVGVALQVQEEVGVQFAGKVQVSAEEDVALVRVDAVAAVAAGTEAGDVEARQLHSVDADADFPGLAVPGDAVAPVRLLCHGREGGAQQDEGQDSGKGRYE